MKININLNSQHEIIKKDKEMIEQQHEINQRYNYLVHEYAVLGNNTLQNY
jgi:hypothetical protein